MQGNENAINDINNTTTSKMTARDWRLCPAVVVASKKLIKFDFLGFFVFNDFLGKMDAILVFIYCGGAFIYHRTSSLVGSLGQL
jgi:hypothetical protein